MKKEQIYEQMEYSDALHEECGVFGMYDFDGNDVASSIYYGLFALQHRGQESCGIAVSDTSGPKGKVSSHRDMGLVNEVFTPEILAGLKGNIGVGHVRYSTAGDSSTRENAQPLVMQLHQGNAGSGPQRQPDQRAGASPGAGVFRCDFPDDHRFRGDRLPHRQRACHQQDGGGGGVQSHVRRSRAPIPWSSCPPESSSGVRDPFGFKPLCIGKRDNAYFIVSETCALDTLGAEFVRDVEPGEIVTISPGWRHPV